MAVNDDNFGQFVDYADCNEEILNSTAYAYMPLSRQILRDRLNPLETYEEHGFLSLLRFTKSALKKVLVVLPLQENTNSCALPVPPLMQLLIALSFYVGGMFQLVSGDLVNVSQPTVSRLVQWKSA